MPPSPPTAGGPDALAGLSGTLRHHLSALTGRVVGIGIAVPASVRDGHAVDAVHLGWHDLDLLALLASPHTPASTSATTPPLAALADARRDALRLPTYSAPRLHVSTSASGGALVVAGQSYNQRQRHGGGSAACPGE